MTEPAPLAPSMEELLRRDPWRGFHLYIGCNIFSTGIVSSRNLDHLYIDAASPQEFAWMKESESWVPVWITLSEISKACSELINAPVKGTGQDVCVPILPVCHSVKINANTTID